MADLFFADISNFQPGADIPTYRASYSVLGEEVTWGTSVTIPAGRLATIRAANFDLVWWYLGLRSDQDISAQVGAFVNYVVPLRANEAVIIDWEATGSVPTPSVAQREEARGLLAKLFNVPLGRIGTYGDTSDLVDAPPPVGAVIVASYETTEPKIPHTAWQFTDGDYTSPPYSPIDFPGIGKCDASVFHGSIEQLQAAFGLPSASIPPGASSMQTVSVAERPNVTGVGPGLDVLTIDADDGKLYWQGDSPYPSNQGTKVLVTPQPIAALSVSATWRPDGSALDVEVLVPHADLKSGDLYTNAMVPANSWKFGDWALIDSDVKLPD